MTDDARIRAALPTIEALRERGARLLLAAHLGRPKDREPELSLRPTADRLSELLGGVEVTLAPDLDHVPDGDLVMLENVRYEKGETKNDPELAKRYAALADVYVNDAFGAAHRAHASTEGVAHLLPSAAGLLLQREVETLAGILTEPQRPLVAIVGGAKVTDKIGVLEAFLERADTILVGGAMCFPFFSAQGHAVGDSLCEAEGIDPARRVLAAAADQLRLPTDLVAGRAFKADTETRDIDGVDVPDGWMGLDVGTGTSSGVRGRDRRGGHGLLERAHGRVRARAVRRRHARGRRGGRRDAGDDGRRRRRQRGGAGEVRPRRPRRPPLDRRWRVARADRGQDAARSGGPLVMTPSRTPFIAGNWKMYKTVAEAEEYVQALLPRVSSAEGVEIAVCTPFTALQAVIDSTRGSRVEVYAQNMHQAPEGAFTGDVSAPMLEEIGVHGVVLGHSERREYFNETDRALAEKVPAALRAGLRPILCVGETEEERERGDTERKLRHQVQAGLEKLQNEQLGVIAIAYEPIWAIGTGLTATPEQAQDAIAFVRALVADRDREQAERTRILYGGSVKPDNAAELLALPDVDGALVGGASLDVDSFAAIIDAAVEAVRS